MSSDRVTWNEFRQYVRRFKPSDILTASAALSALNSRRALGSGPSGTEDFALALIAKTAICHGNEFRRAKVTNQEIRKLCRMVVNLPDPFLIDKNVGSFMVRIGHEQLPYQAAHSQPIGRTRALLIDAAAAAKQHVINASFWRSALGCTLEEFVGVSLLLYAASIKHSGTFDQSWLNHPNFAPVFEQMPRDVVSAVIDRWFVQTVEQFRVTAEAADLRDFSLKRYEFNPLLRAPFVAIGSNAPIAPVLPRVLLRATPGSLYYIGIEHGQDEFANALGSVFETYVGMQLKLSNPESLIGEREFRKGAKSVDYIVILSSVLLLVEVKATPLTIRSRLGLESLRKDIARVPGKAEVQIERTAKLVRERNVAFSDVPPDKPILGMIVTLEPYFACDNNWVIRIRSAKCTTRELTPENRRGRRPAA